MAAKPIGKLEVKVCRAERLKDIQTFGKMDPYVTLACAGGEKFKTKVMTKAGTNPVFNQNFIFNLDGKTEPILHVHVMDSQTLGDGVIGRVDIQLADLCKTHTEQRFQIVDKNSFKTVNGEIVLQCVHYKGTVLANQPPVVVAAPAPQVVYQQAPAPQPQVVYQQAPAPQPQVVYQQPQQPQVVYQQAPQPQVVYQPAPAPQPQVVYVQQPAQPRVVYVQQPGPQVVYMQGRRH